MKSEKRLQEFPTDDVSLTDLGSACDWLNQISHTARPIRSTTQIWLVTHHQYGISALVSQTSFGGETSDSVAKCRLFSPATSYKWPRTLFGLHFGLWIKHMRTVEMKSNEERSSQLWTQFMQLHKEPEKIQDFIFFRLRTLLSRAHGFKSC